jgi:hypothetical protein
VTSFTIHFFTYNLFCVIGLRYRLKSDVILSKRNLLVVMIIYTKVGR